MTIEHSRIAFWPVILAGLAGFWCGLLTATCILAWWFFSQYSWLLFYFQPWVPLLPITRFP
jgi:hypothetical protein